MTQTHLFAALSACLVLAAGIVGGTRYAEWQEELAVHAVAGKQFAQKDAGRALQAAAVQQPDLLPLFASSDLHYNGPEQAGALFSAEPTGFAVFTIGRPGAQPLSYIQRLAALGTSLRGKRVAFTLTPNSFFRELGQFDGGFYAGSFSVLPATELAFSTDLSIPLKQAVARRMLDYPDTLAGHPLLAFALGRLGDGSTFATAEYVAAVPLGRLQVLVLRLQDHWATLQYLRAHTELLAAPSRTATGRLDWQTLANAARQAEARRAGRNPYGFESGYWKLLARGRLDALEGDPALATQRFESNEVGAPAWTDYELLLRTAAELGAQPLVFSPPLKGRYYDASGVSPAARAQMYDRVEQLAARYGATLDDFRAHDEDLLFVENRGSHPGAVGWVYYDRDLDAFFHTGQLPDPRPAAATAARR